jgi:hypothetical protein
VALAALNAANATLEAFRTCVERRFLLRDALAVLLGDSAIRPGIDPYDLLIDGVRA